MHIIYAQKTLFPRVSMAHALHTYASIGEMLNTGARVDFFPGGDLGHSRKVIRDFFTDLGFAGAYADLALPCPVSHKGLYGLGFRMRFCAALRRAKKRAGERTEEDSAKARRGKEKARPGGAMARTVIHASSVKEACMGIQARRLCKARQVPLAFEIHHLVSMHKEGREADKWAALERKAFNEADLIVFISDDLKRLAAERLPAPKNAITLPNGFNQNNIFPITPEERHAAGDTSGVNLAYAGSLLPGKGVEELLAAMALLPEGYRLKVLGGHPPERLAALRQTAGASGLGARVTFAGQLRQKDLRQELLDCDICVIPLNTDNNFFSPIKLFEALGFGLPIACSPAPTLKEHLTERANAVFAKENTPQGLAMAIAALGADPDLRQSMRQNNSALSLEHSNRRRIAKLLDVYEDLAERA